MLVLVGIMAISYESGKICHYLPSQGSQDAFCELTKYCKEIEYEMPFSKRKADQYDFIYWMLCLNAKICDRIVFKLESKRVVGTGFPKKLKSSMIVANSILYLSRYICIFSRYFSVKSPFQAFFF